MPTAAQQLNFNLKIGAFRSGWMGSYISIGLLGGIIWVYRKEIKWAWIFYLVQLALRFGWACLLFGAYQVEWALVDVTLLVLCMLLTLFYTFSTSKIATLILILCLPKMIFAFLLNLLLWSPYLSGHVLRFLGIDL